MTDKLFERGLRVRRQVLGAAYVGRQLNTKAARRKRK